MAKKPHLRNNQLHNYRYSTYKETIMKYLLAILTLSLITISTPVWADDGLVGEWQLRVEGRRGVQTPILQIAQENKKFSGKIGGQRGKIDIEQITVVDETFSFPFAMETPMGDFKLLSYKEKGGLIPIFLLGNC